MIDGQIPGGAGGSQPPAPPPDNPEDTPRKLWLDAETIMASLRGGHDTVYSIQLKYTGTDLTKGESPYAHTIATANQRVLTLQGIEAIGHKYEGFEVVALWPLGKLRDFADASTKEKV
jgi:hypothetical protein